MYSDDDAALIFIWKKICDMHKQQKNSKLLVMHHLSCDSVPIVFNFIFNWYGNYVSNVCEYLWCIFLALPTCMLNFKWQCCSISYLHYIYVHSFVLITSPIKHINLATTQKKCVINIRGFPGFTCLNRIFLIYISRKQGYPGI